jgi:hypothetical protein
VVIQKINAYSTQIVHPVILYFIRRIARWDDIDLVHNGAYPAQQQRAHPFKFIACTTLVVDVTVQPVLEIPCSPDISDSTVKRIDKNVDVMRIYPASPSFACARLRCNLRSAATAHRL